MFVNRVNYVFLLFLFLALLSCAGSPRFTSERENFAKNIKNKSQIISAEDTVQAYRDISITSGDMPVLETETGIASYYADAFNGKITYNGEVYNMNGISAAHQTYPMGTVLRVSNLKNGKSVILRVNDRMPYNPNRIIDLSLGAARELDMVIEGLTKVKIEVLKFGSGR